VAADEDKIDWRKALSAGVRQGVTGTVASGLGSAALDYGLQKGNHGAWHNPGKTVRTGLAGAGAGALLGTGVGIGAELLAQILERKMSGRDRQAGLIREQVKIGFAQKDQ